MTAAAVAIADTERARPSSFVGAQDKFVAFDRALADAAAASDPPPQPPRDDPSAEPPPEPAPDAARRREIEQHRHLAGANSAPVRLRRAARSSTEADMRVDESQPKCGIRTAERGVHARLIAFASIALCHPAVTSVL